MVNKSEAYDILPEKIKQQIEEKGNVFFSKAYEDYTLLRNEKLIYVYNDEFLVMVKNRKAFIFNFGLFVSEPMCLEENVDEKAMKLFLDEAVSMMADTYGTQWLYSPASAIFMDFPSKSKVIPWGNYVLELQGKTEEELLMTMHSKHRNVVRRAQKSDVVVKQGTLELLDDYIELDKATWERSNTTSSGKEYYSQILRAMPENARIFVAYKEDIPQAGALIFYNQTMGYYMYGATKNSPETGAANLVQWEIIRFLREYGTKEYSFVGCRINEDKDSKYHGIQNFKARFGGDLKQGYLFRKEVKPYMYKLFCLAMQLRSKNKFKKYKDAVDEEIHKWKDIQE